MIDEDDSILVFVHLFTISVWRWGPTEHLENTRILALNKGSTSFCLLLVIRDAALE